MKSMLPSGAVRQKMTMDGIPDADIDAFLGEDDDSGGGGGGGGGGAGAGAPPPPGPPSGGGGGGIPPPPSLATAEGDASFSGSGDPRYAKYDKMRQMLPEGAVRQKMMLEGFTETEMDKYFS
jgi:hypothetical protein